MVSRKSIGSAWERTLRDLLFKKGILVFRIAGSGSTKKYPATDLIALSNNKAICLEVKHMKELGNVYIRENQVYELVEISKYTEVWIAVHISSLRTWKFVKFNNIRMIPKDVILKGLSLEQFVEYLKSKQLN